MSFVTKYSLGCHRIVEEGTMPSSVPSQDRKSTQCSVQGIDLMVKALQPPTVLSLRSHTAHAVSQASVRVTAAYNPRIFSFIEEAFLKVINSRSFNYLTLTHKHTVKFGKGKHKPTLKQR
jgi:hypothetical protein